MEYRRLVSPISHPNPSHHNSHVLDLNAPTARTFHNGSSRLGNVRYASLPPTISTSQLTPPFYHTGAAARWWQLGIQMRPHFAKESLYPYPIYMAVAAGFGYYLQGAEEKQKELVQ